MATEQLDQGAVTRLKRNRRIFGVLILLGLTVYGINRYEERQHELKAERDAACHDVRERAKEAWSQYHLTLTLHDMKSLSAERELSSNLVTAEQRQRFKDLNEKTTKRIAYLMASMAPKIVTLVELDRLRKIIKQSPPEIEPPKVDEFAASMRQRCLR